jgi:predicted phage tail protein
MDLYMAENTIKSMAILRQLHLISAGKTGGMPLITPAGKVDQLCSTYVNDVPIKYYDGTIPKYNMGDSIKVITRNGVANQAEILSVGGIANTADVSTEVKQAVPVTRSVQSAATSATVTIGFPEGISFNGEPGTVALKIWIKLSTSSTWILAKDVSYTDFSSSGFEESWRVDRPAGIGAWQTKLERITGDSTDTRYRNKTTFASIVEWIPDSTTYSNYAIAAFVADAKNLNSSSTPVVSFLWDGIYCQVPVNYTPLTYDGNGVISNPSYSGSWDGITFVEKVTSNPVWIMLYLLTNTVNGLGQRILMENIDIWNFYNSAKYCDELLPVTIDGVSTTRPRYTFDWQFLERVDAWSLLSEIAGAINATLTYMGDRIAINMDRPGTADMVITQDSVIDGKITWSGSSRKDLKTSACVKWYNPTNNYKAEELTITADEYFGAGAGYITKYGYTI